MVYTVLRYVGCSDILVLCRAKTPNVAKKHLAQLQPRQMAAKSQPVVRAPPAAVPARTKPPGVGSTAQTASAAGSTAALPTTAAGSSTSRIAALQEEVESLTEKVRAHVGNEHGKVLASALRMCHCPRQYTFARLCSDWAQFASPRTTGLLC